MKSIVLLVICLIALAVAHQTLPMRKSLKRGVTACTTNPCQSGETCCNTPNGPGCCPAPNACCCPDEQHCCQQGYQCVCSGNPTVCTDCTTSGGQCESKAF